MVKSFPNSSFLALFFHTDDFRAAILRLNVFSSLVNFLKNLWYQGEAVEVLKTLATYGSTWLLPSGIRAEVLTDDCRAAILEPSLFFSLVNMLNKLWPQDEALDLLKTWVPYGIWLFRSPVSLYFCAHFSSR
jgi:hypothetical protein